MLQRDSSATDDDAQHVIIMVYCGCDICRCWLIVLNCLTDTDGDGVCDGDEVAGYTDASACNFDSSATDDNGSCTYADAGLDVQMLLFS